ncbi:MAG TPA: sirohydrochlorin cobaltochelatase [Tissierellales bacterium]|nr:sirohydrochlorin cobaltochelatase [Tissierellales bacterium]
MKKGILVVSFGTSYEKTRKLCIRAIEDKIQERFKDYTVRRAFTSNMIIRKLKKRDNLYIDTVDEALKKFREDGFNQVFVQPLHIIPGHEYEKIVKEVEKYNKDKVFDKLKLGEPLLYNEEDYSYVIRALEKDIDSLKEEEKLILMGHGTDHNANKCYKILEEKLREKGYKNVYIGTAEGYQPIEEIIPLLKERKSKEVNLQPFMLVAGDHVLNDMVGKEDSWKVKLENKGFIVGSKIKGLGEKEEFQNIFINKLEYMLY